VHVAPAVAVRNLSAAAAQSVLKLEAADSSIEEQLKEKEAIQAENAANFAKLAESDAAVGWPSRIA
jgi:hypothetical protein